MRHSGGVEKNLKRYLEVEARLNTFFAAFHYCFSRCVAVEMARNGNNPVTACCTDRYYALYDLQDEGFVRLRQERERIYGRPQDQHWTWPVSVCEYHNPDRGCVLSTHKSPICNAFLCRQAIDCLRDEFGVYTYDYLGFHYALEWILTGAFPDDQYLAFRDAIDDMTQKITSRPDGS